MTVAARILSTFFGAGYFPLAPGTFASLLAGLFYRFVLYRLAPLPYALLVAGIFLLGVAASTPCARSLQTKDPRRIVIDEVGGQFVALFMIPAGWTFVAAGFILFRLFDVLKPFPIRRIERLPWGWGIMADDVLAGIYAALLLHAYLWVR
jgi:phosphatidylglycerophosphatase A